MTIRHCPTCGSGRIRRQTVTVTASIRGKRVRVPDLELELCPDCGEKLFDLEASRRMEEQSLPKRRRRSVAAA